MAKQSAYIKQDWAEYNNSLDMNTNIEFGGVVTPERMEHIEDGIYHANLPIELTIEAGDEDYCMTEEKDDRRVLRVMTTELEPKHFPLDIVITPFDKDETIDQNDIEKNKRKIEIRSNKVEPKWPNKLAITLNPAKTDNVQIKDDLENDLRRIIINSSFLNTVAIKPIEREIVIYYEDWRSTDIDKVYEADVYIEADIQPNNFVRFTYGSEITPDQIACIQKCNVQIIPQLDGSFKAVANDVPDIELPFHAAIL